MLVSPEYFFIIDFVCAMLYIRVQVAKVCSGCGIVMGEYFCEVCRFYDDEVMGVI